MSPWVILLLSIGGAAILVLLISFFCFLKTFYSKPRKPLKKDEYETAEGEIYKPYREEMIEWIKDLRNRPHEDFTITSFDGLTLRGKYYEYKKGAPIELMFHGYRSTAERDLCGGAHRCFSVDHNAFIVNQRAAGDSDGHVISFGVNERKDCLKWIDFIIDHFGKDVQIILTGISMGGATVLTAAGEHLPDNVKFILSDCGFSSPKAIIQKVIKEMHLPPAVVYPFIKLGARIFGGFNLDEASAIKAMGTCETPIILFHGKADDYVPYQMSEEVFKSCKAHKKLVLVEGAGHGLSCMIDNEGYIQALKEFERECGICALL